MVQADGTLRLELIFLYSASGGGCNGQEQETEQLVGAIYRLHRGDRSNDLKRLPMASCRQCQTSALAFGGSWPELLFDSLLLVCRGGDAADTAVALASRQCPLAVFLMGSGFSDGLMVSGLVDGLSAGIAFVADATISVFAGVLNSSSLSPFAGSFAA